jgi:2-phospho-L-lactate/phosphoenolpyruvate guanylyltransferase
MGTLAILPIKSFDHAKQRLEPGLGPGPRRALAEAMFSDVLVALGRAELIDGVLVVTSDRGAQLIAGGHGTMVLDDLDRGHSEAAVRGIQEAIAADTERVLLVPGDCPTINPVELDALIARPVTAPSAVIVPDRHGTGTNALLLTPPGALAPAFGPGSRDRHVENARAVGAYAEVIEVPSLALDIDTPEDLVALQSTLDSTRGGAAHTRGMLKQLWRSRH